MVADEQAVFVSETIHLITGEYPPDRGGVSGYTAEVARAMAADETAVHVWCPGRQAVSVEDGVRVHRALGSIGAADLRRASAELDGVPAPRRLIVQWVPQAFGRRSLNVGFCRWVRRRARVCGDAVDVMVHEPFVDFSPSPRRMAAAAVHRVMVATLLQAASRVWVSTPAWADRWRPYARRDLPFGWLPIPATLPVDEAARHRGAEVRRSLTGGGGCVIGSFSSSGRFVEEALAEAVVPVLAAGPGTALLLVGNGSVDTRDALAVRAPSVASRIHATGPLEPGEVSRHLGACDFAVQPCADGVCARHSSIATLIAHGVPVVTTSGRFTEPMWSQSGALALAPAGDHDAMRRLVDQLVDDPSARAHLARRGADLYESRLHVRHTVAAFSNGVGLMRP